MHNIISLFFSCLFFINSYIACGVTSETDIKYRNNTTIEPAKIKISSDENNIHIIFNIEDGWCLYSNKDSGTGKALNISIVPEESSMLGLNIPYYQILWPEPIEKITKIGEQKFRDFVYEKNVDIVARLLSNEISIRSIRIEYSLCSNICMSSVKEFIFQNQVFTEVTESDNKVDKWYILFLNIVFAIIGGFILNLMPCVLPIISLKLNYLIKYSGLSTSNIKLNILANIFGILASFFLLAIVTAFLKFSGQEVGWGLHFQNPSFVIFLILILILFINNLFGYFEFNLSPTITTLFNNNQQKVTFTKSFCSGFFAALLGMPCTAPFLGTAVAFALTENYPYIFIIYIFIGIGMSMPYILLLLNPDILKKFPKSGTWLLIIKQTLNLFLIGTVCWLLYILYNQLTYNAFLSFLVSIILLQILISFKKNNLYLKLSLLIWMIFLVSVAFILFKNDKNAHEVSVQEVENFEYHKLKKYIDDDKLIFVEITADWCLTCKINHLLFLNNTEITSLFKNEGVIVLKGDYTNHDNEITNYLKKHNRYGIPFYVVYGEAAKDGIILSEVLTKNTIIGAIQKASKGEFAKQ